MVKEEIVAGLKFAIAKGESLERAMTTFYNSGYSKPDVEEAASSLGFTHPSQPQTQAVPQVSPAQQTQQPKQPQPETESKSDFHVPQPIHPHEEPQIPQTLYPMLDQSKSVVQKVSGYGGERPPSPMSSIVIFTLVFFLLVFVGVLIAAFLFKDELSGFFNSFV